MRSSVNALMRKKNIHYSLLIIHFLLHDSRLTRPQLPGVGQAAHDLRSSLSLIAYLPSIIFQFL
jgi:hypothetical protein